MLAQSKVVAVETLYRLIVVEETRNGKKIVLFQIFVSCPLFPCPLIIQRARIYPGFQFGCCAIV